jgi:NAD-dependent dihydropyrimidine dehydrogenase PreA subunit
MCTAVCPTGAIRRTTGEDRMTLTVKDALCNACRSCEAACIDRAIEVQPVGELRFGTRELRTITGRPCAACGAFSARGNLCRFCAAKGAGRLGRRPVVS